MPRRKQGEMPQKATFSVSLNPVLVQKIDGWALVHGLTRSQLIGDICEEYLSRQGVKNDPS